MTRAYDEESLDKAMDSLGEMMEYAALDVKIPAAEFYQWFLVSGIADRFGTGETAVVNGMSGVELAREIIWLTKREEIGIPAVLHIEKGAEYWAGWALAYYQWYCIKPFRIIEEIVPFASILSMYHPYHEMDITQFAAAMDQKMHADSTADPAPHPSSVLIAGNHNPQRSRIRRLRKYAELTQKELAAASGVPLRTIQQYEQGQKDLRKAAADTVLRLSYALHCQAEDLL